MVQLPEHARLWKRVSRLAHCGKCFLAVTLCLCSSKESIGRNKSALRGGGTQNNRDFSI